MNTFQIEKDKNNLPIVILGNGYTWDDINYEMKEYQIFQVDTSAPVYYSEIGDAYYIGRKEDRLVVSTKGTNDSHKYLSFINIAYHASNLKEMHNFKHTRHMICESHNDGHRPFLDARYALNGGQTLKARMKKRAEEFRENFIDLDEINNRKQSCYIDREDYLKDLERLKKNLFVGMTIIGEDDDSDVVAGGKVTYRLQHLDAHSMIVASEEGEVLRVPIKSFMKKYIGNGAQFDHIYLERKKECIPVG